MPRIQLLILALLALLALIAVPANADATASSYLGCIDCGAGTAVSPNCGATDTGTYSAFAAFVCTGPDGRSYSGIAFVQTGLGPYGIGAMMETNELGGEDSAIVDGVGRTEIYAFPRCRLI
jgi:hypothetical protein